MQHTEWLEEMVSASEVHKRADILLMAVTPESLENPNDKLVDGNGSNSLPLSIMPKVPEDGDS